MPRTTPVGSGLGTTCDVLFQHQTLRDEFARRGDDRCHVRSLVGMAFKNGGARIAGSAALLGRLRKWDVAALEAQLRAVTVPARSQIPSGVSAERRADHRCAYARH